jgi:hypothetical protein
MNSAEVVMHEMERERVFMVFQFFRKSVRQSGTRGNDSPNARSLQPRFVLRDSELGAKVV